MNNAVLWISFFVPSVVGFKSLGSKKSTSSKRPCVSNKEDNVEDCFDM